MLKSVKDLILSGYEFIIPSYQRGYRWTEREVQELLDDLYNFYQESRQGSSEKYCLQPIVVKRAESFLNKEIDRKLKDLDQDYREIQVKFESLITSYDESFKIEKSSLLDRLNEKRFILIDGQQRLTSIFLILSYLKNTGKLTDLRLDISFSYQTRAGSLGLLGSDLLLRQEDKAQSLDEYYMIKASKLIDSWFSNKNLGEKLSREEFLNFLDRLEVIFYELDKDEDPVEVFTRINSAKIPLTNSELIKGLLLNSKNIGFFSQVNNREDIRAEQVRISKEWDEIERKLQDDDFWYFLSNKDDRPSRIDLIFDILADQISKDKTIIEDSFQLKKNNRDRYSFYVFNEYFKYALKEGNTLIDIWLSVKKIYMILVEFYKDFEFYHKIGYLLARRVDRLSLGQILNLYEMKKDKGKIGFSKQLDSLIGQAFIKDGRAILPREVFYENRKKSKDYIRDILLLHNIDTILKQDKPSYDRDYIRFPFQLYKKEKWDIEHIQPVNPNEESEYFKEEDINSLSNLCLLMKDANIDFSNKNFREKRNKLIEEYDVRGRFILVTTRNVFLKYYSRDIENMDYWTEKDGQAYLKDIEKSFFTYVKETEDD